MELKLYSPIQIDIIDRDHSDHPIPLQAVSGERAGEYLGRIMNAFRELQPQEDARNAFTAPGQDWSEVCEKIVSLTRAVELIGGKTYGVFTCRSRGKLNAEEVDDLKWHCRDQWEEGWGEGYAHCPREGVSSGLYIHFWQDDAAPLLTRDELEAARSAEQEQPAVTSSPIAEIIPDTFWTLLAQAKAACDGNQRAVYWLTERLLDMGPEQALNFHSIVHGYMELADKFGLWNAAILIHGDGCYADGFEDFRAWLIFQGREIYEEFDPARYDALKAELTKDIVYGDGIGYPYDATDVPAYLPRLCQRYMPEGVNIGAWNGNSLEIRAARATAQKSKKIKKDRGESR